MGKRLLQKLEIIAIWIVISIALYQCASGDLEETNPQIPYEEEQEKSEDKEQTEQEDKIVEGREIPQGYIRVLIKTDDFAGIYHGEVVVSSESGMYIEEDKKITTLAPKEEYVLSKSELCNKKIDIKPYQNGYLCLHNVKRLDEVFYRGKIECYGTQDGIVLVNELPVEEYLYGVVPSEMPSGYPMEALKAQAISARTYTYFHMSSFAYPEWCAHVDDSTAFQVYKNISENETVNQAVDATRGQVIKYGDEVIESFYYSTSSGRSSGYEVWKPQEQKEWLLAKALVAEQQDMGVMDDFAYTYEEDSYETIQERENAYRTYISQGNVNDVEYAETWYRWKYTRDFGDLQSFLERIESLKEKYPDEILIRSKYKNKGKLTQESEILSCRILQRESSGMVQQLCIQTKNFEIIIKTQQCIREVLAKSGDTIRKKDDSTFTLGELLPSAYFYFDTLYEDNALRSMTIYGGGFGHGAGMSQNGAKCLANRGMKAEDILKYYYSGVDVEEIK